LSEAWHFPEPQPCGAEGHGKLSSPSAAGQHSSPEHHTPLPGHCTASPTLQLNSVVQSYAFSVFSHRWSPHPVGAEGHGKFAPPTPGQHCSPLHVVPFVPGHWTVSPTLHCLPSVQSNSFFAPVWHMPSPHFFGADGQGKLGPPSMPGQHSSPKHQMPLPGHCTVSPMIHCQPSVQSYFLLLLWHCPKPQPFGAEGHGKFGAPSCPGQHSSPLHQVSLPGHRTASPTEQ